MVTAIRPVRARSFGNAPPPSTGPKVQVLHGVRRNQPFQPLPDPTGDYPYRLALVDVIPGIADEITGRGKMVFHSAGDTGGIKHPEIQQAVADAMEKEADDNRPMFFFHLGDIIYFYGERSQYFGQFYEPYSNYTVPMFGVPGNHDGDIAPGSTDPSLAGFVENFCAKNPELTPEAQEVNRHAMTQPNVYWTLVTPMATIIGLYSNCPEGGQIENNQAAWLAEELAAADSKHPVVVTLHHPPYSADGLHSGSVAMGRVLDSAFQTAGRSADAVFAGHVHNYQRFIRQYNGRDIPYIVAGAGGYYNLHKVQDANRNPVQVPYEEPGSPDTRLVKYVDNKFGFMRVSVTDRVMQVDYVAVDARAATDPASAAVAVEDSWQLDYRSGRVSGGGSGSSSGGSSGRAGRSGTTGRHRTRTVRSGRKRG